MGELGDLLELLHRGGRDLRSVRATIRTGHDPEVLQAVAVESMERSGAPASQVAAFRAQASGPAPDRVTHLWLQPPDRHREESDWGVNVRDGERWWRAPPGMPPMTNHGDPARGQAAPAEHQHLFRPGAFVGQLDLEAAGETEVAGRATRLVRARPDPPEPPAWSELHRLGMEADAYELAVDAERGVLLRVVAFHGGRMMTWTTVEAVAFDEDLDPTLFCLDLPPGEEFADPRDLMGPRRARSLAEVAREAPFSVFAPREVPPGWHADAYFKPAQAGGPAFAMIAYAEVGARAHLSIFQQPGDAASAGFGGELEWRRQDELEVGESDLGAGVRLERDGTRIELRSSELAAEELVRVARTLEPVSPDPPRFAG